MYIYIHILYAYIYIYIYTYNAAPFFPFSVLIFHFGASLS